jgi:hypothetical protein
MGHHAEAHVVYTARGTWEVVQPGKGRAASQHATKRDAVRTAKELLRHRGGEAVIHDRDGLIVESSRVRRSDPKPAR